MKKDHPEAYLPKNADYQISAKMLREELTSGARTILLVLLVASGLVFVIACSNVANLILSRTVRAKANWQSGPQWARLPADFAARYWQKASCYPWWARRLECSARIRW
jgi:hypothetical protein